MKTAVRNQLVEAVADRVTLRECSEAHPYGSTVAIERWVEWDIEGSTVFIPVEGDELPIRVKGTVCKGDQELQLVFTLDKYHARSGEAEYTVEMDE